MEHHHVENVCHRCIGDTYLANELLRDGELRPCSLCFARRQTFTLDELAERIHKAISEHFQLTLDYPVEPEDYNDIAMGLDWERKGYSPNDLITEIAGVDQDIADAIVQLLSESHAYSAVRNGSEDPYGSEARYEEVGPGTGPFWSIWNSVPDSIRHQARFFNIDAEQALGRLFAELNTLRTKAAESVVQTIGSGLDKTFIWRARKAISERQLETILTNPALEMGPPPPERTPSGRMNSAGIPVFYGALDHETCIAEVRPPVGSYVVTGRFEVLEPVRLLDLNLLQDIVIEETYFDPQYADRSNRVAFLKQLAQELTKPVMPEDEEKEYIATQIIAEYLAHRAEPRVDGILFRSSQTDPPGSNVVLFNHASQVEKSMVQADTTTVIGMPSRDDDESDDQMIVVWKFDDSEHPNRTNIEAQYDFEAQGGGNFNQSEPDYDPRLKLDIDSLVVHKIRAVKPECTALEIVWVSNH